MNDEQWWIEVQEEAAKLLPSWKPSKNKTLGNADIGAATQCVVRAALLKMRRELGLDVHPTDTRS
jgi:hypothetical protein